MKAQTLHDLHYNIVYKIPCAECEKLNVFETRRCIKIETYSHNFKFEETPILGKHENYEK